MRSGIKCPDISNLFPGGSFYESKRKQQTLNQGIINQGASAALSQQPRPRPVERPTFLAAPPGSRPPSPARGQHGPSLPSAPGQGEPKLRPLGSGDRVGSAGSGGVGSSDLPAQVTRSARPRHRGAAGSDRAEKSRVGRGKGEKKEKEAGKELGKGKHQESRWETRSPDTRSPVFFHSESEEPLPFPGS